MRKDTAGTPGSLAMLFDRLGFAEELYFIAADCCDWCDCAPGCSHCGDVPKDEDEKENAVNIRLLFLDQDEKAMEKAEIAKGWL